jgi:hypothetical protein
MSLNRLDGYQTGDRDLPTVHFYHDVATVLDPESGDDSDASAVERRSPHRRQMFTHETADDASDLGGIVRTKDGSLQITVVDPRLVRNQGGERWHAASVAP